MKRFIWLLGCVLLLGACGTWQETTRKGLKLGFETLKSADATTNAFMHKRCMTIAAKQCEAGKPCKALEDCQALKHKIEDGIIEGDKLVIKGLLAVEAGAKLEAGNYLDKLKGVATQVLDLFKKAEVQ
jgi:hypothetical protein